MNLYDFGKRSGHKTARLSIGSMRLPKDVDKAVALIRYAIDNGLSYIDTSRGYGEVEWIIGLALKDGYREKVLLSTKWSPWIVKIDDKDDASSDCVRRRIEESMKRLDVDYLDYYQVWNINGREHYNEAIAKNGMIDGMLRAKDEGLVGHLGFTTHDTVENILSYISESDWCDVILLSYNLLNIKYAPVLKAAHEAGIGVTVMNPVGGGRFTESSLVLDKLIVEADADSAPDMAVRYVLSNPCVNTMLIGIAKAADVDDSIASLRRGGFDSERIRKIDMFMDTMRKQSALCCTGCGYCVPCPEGVDIVEIMACVDDFRLWGWEKKARERYERIKGKKAGSCTRCGKCMKVCTQKLDIIANMDYAIANFEPPLRPA